MKKYFFLISLALSGFGALAQQAPQFTQFMQTGNVINPALTGINRYTDFKLGYRKQWAGLQNSPSTLFASVSGQLGNREPTISLPVRGRLANQFLTSKPEKKDGIKHALGGFILADQTNPTSFNMGNLSYALHVPLGKAWKLSVGAGLSLAQTSLNRDKLNVDVSDDPGVGTGINSRINPDLNAGFFLHSENLFFGYSGNFLFRNKIYSLSDKNTLVGQQKVHHYGIMGAKFDLNESWFISPAVMLKHVAGAPISADVNLRFGYRDILWFGPSFRNQDSFSALAGFHLSNFLSLSYAYDYTYSQLNTASNGSHEIILGLRMVESGTKIKRPTM